MSDTPASLSSGSSFTMFTAIILVALAYCLSIPLWQIASRYILMDPLDNIPGPAPASFLKGNLPQLFDRFGWDFQDELGERYGSVVKVNSFLGRKMLYVYDPTALYDIVIKDPYTFEPLKWFLSFVGLVFGSGLPATHGDQHRKQRKLLNPVFSGAHIRNMTPMFYQIAHKLREGMSAELKDSATKELNVLSWVHRAALELVGRGSFGYSFKSLEHSSADAYGEALKAVAPVVFSLGFLRILSPLVSRMTTPMRRSLVRYLPHAGVREMARLARVMDDKARHVFYAKKAAVLGGASAAGDGAILNEGDGKDLMSVLLRANVDAIEGDQLPEDELIGQMSALVFAGTDTTSGAVSQIINLLAQHPEVQEKLRAEIMEAREGGDLPHDALMALPYLDAVCRETLRLHPPASWVYREAVKETVLPLSKPMRGVDGTMLKEVQVPKGTTIVIAIRASNLNHDLWGPDAREWKPERWLSPLPESVRDAKIPGVYSHLMTFLGGGRACVGFKYSQLAIKVILSVLLSSFRFKASRDIYWNLSTFSYPSASRSSEKPEMPIVVDTL